MKRNCNHIGVAKASQNPAGRASEHIERVLDFKSSKGTEVVVNSGGIPLRNLSPKVLEHWLSETLSELLY